MIIYGKKGNLPQRGKRGDGLTVFYGKFSNKIMQNYH